MYEATNNLMNGSMNGTCQKQEKPFHIEAADKIFETFADMPHQQQVEAFKYLQKKLADYRVSQNERMQKELADHSNDVNIHAQGTAVIASGIPSN